MPQLSPPQQRILRYLGADNTGATRNGFQAKQLGDLTGASRDDFAALAEAAYIAGRANGSSAEPHPDVVLAATNPWTLRIHLTPAGAKAAETLST